jgi:hypothetical protein
MLRRGGRGRGSECCCGCSGLQPRHRVTAAAPPPPGSANRSTGALAWALALRNRAKRPWNCPIWTGFQVFHIGSPFRFPGLPTGRSGYDFQKNLQNRDLWVGWNLRQEVWVGVRPRRHGAGRAAVQSLAPGHRSRGQPFIRPQPRWAGVDHEPVFLPCRRRPPPGHFPCRRADAVLERQYR